jgi:hypothetical protein
MRRFAPIALLAILVLGLVPAVAFAQPPGKPTDPTPVPSGDTTSPTPQPIGPAVTAPTQSPAASPSSVDIPRLDLAAMVLDSTDMPEGFTIFYELYVPGDRISSDLTGGLISPEEIASSGIEWYYESVYLSSDGSTRVRSYVEQYADAAGATRGFELLEDEIRLAPEGSVFTDGPGAGVGEEPAEISEGSLQPSGTTPVVNSIDSTFRTGNLLAGVSVDTLPDVPADKQLAIDLSGVLFDRIQTVLANQSLPLVDYALPGQLVALSPGFQGHDEGYLSATEIFGPDAAAPVGSSFVSGYFTNQSLISTDEVPLPIPLVSITVGKFQDENSALQVLGDSAVLQPPFDSVEPLDIGSIPGASVVQAFTYANPMLSASSQDSVRIVMVVGGNLVILDVQANKTLDGAQEAAIQIATAQADCLQSTAACAPIELPAGLLEAPDLATPIPSETPLPVG